MQTVSLFPSCGDCPFLLPSAKSCYFSSHRKLSFSWTLGLSPSLDSLSEPMLCGSSYTLYSYFFLHRGSAGCKVPKQMWYVEQASLTSLCSCGNWTMPWVSNPGPAVLVVIWLWPCLRCRARAPAGSGPMLARVTGVCFFKSTDRVLSSFNGSYLS